MVYEGGSHNYGCIRREKFSLFLLVNWMVSVIFFVKVMQADILVCENYNNEVRPLRHGNFYIGLLQKRVKIRRRLDIAFSLGIISKPCNCNGTLMIYLLSAMHSRSETRSEAHYAYAERASAYCEC